MPTAMVTGIRFYKGIGNTGTHVGSLWTATGTKLADATFTNETATGWQRVDFATPVAINAGVTYVASYFAPNGHYSLNRTIQSPSPAPGLEEGVINAPLRALADGEEGGGNGVFRVGTPGFPTQSFGSSNYWVDVLFVPNSSSTLFVSARSPVHGALSVSPLTLVTARFSADLDVSSITTTSFQLQGPTGGVPAAVTYYPATRTLVLDPTQRLVDGTVYTATVQGGPGGLRSAAGLTITADVTWSFTTSTPVVCPCTIWTPETVPTFLVNNADDAQAVAQGIELGVKFRADADGFISGIRFYKSANNIGTHTGTLWTLNGTALAHGTFTTETPSGWQQLTFDPPVPVIGNQTYVASYHTNVGRYSVNHTYFLPQFTPAFTRAPLRALIDGQDGPNGVYNYGPHSFPTQTFLQSNYWVDVVFMPAGSGPMPPLVVSHTPAAGAVGVDRLTNVTAHFSESLDPSTVTTATVELRDTQTGTLVPAAVSYDDATRTVTLNPGVMLAAGTAYTATIRGGATGIRDLQGDAMVGNVTWSFSTMATTECPCTIWPSTTTPAGIIDNSGDVTAATQGVELGVRFRADAAGYINGIRFYKGPNNVGVHTGSLWDNSGNLIATATFTNESASGWQEVRFATPVQIQPNVTYVASYHAPSGGYSVDAGYFVPANGPLFARPPLRALAAGVDGPNGVSSTGRAGSRSTRST